MIPEMDLDEISPFDERREHVALGPNDQLDAEFPRCNQHVQRCRRIQDCDDVLVRDTESMTRSWATKASSERSGPPPMKRGIMWSIFNAAPDRVCAFKTRLVAGGRHSDAPLAVARNDRSQRR